MQIKLKKSAYFLTALSAVYISLAPISANAQVIAAGSIATTVVNSMRDSILQIISSLDNSVNSGTFQTRIQLTNLLAELDYQAAGLEGKTFRDLNDSQQKFFNNTQVAISDINALGGHFAEKADSVTASVNFAIGTVPFTSKEPRVKLQSPHVVTESASLGNVPISIDGMWLANGKPKLKMGIVDCALVSLTEPRASFDCPGVAFKSTNGQTHSTVVGQFSAVKDRTFWESAWSIFGAQSKPKIYPVAVGVVPDIFSRITVSANHEEDTEEFKDRSETYDTGQEHCVTKKETTLNISPQGPEWNIDVNSIELHPGGGDATVLNKTLKGFQLHAVAYNRGSCVYVLGHKVADDARGHGWGSVTWKEHHTVHSDVKSIIFDDNIKWGESRVASLPPSTKSFKVSVKLFNGTDREYNASTHDEFLKIDADASVQNLRISPLPIEEAFK